MKITELQTTPPTETITFPVSIEDAHELQDVLCTLTCTGTALKTSARELVEAFNKLKNENTQLRMELIETKDKHEFSIKELARGNEIIDALRIERDQLRKELEEARKLNICLSKQIDALNDAVIESGEF